MIAPNARPRRRLLSLCLATALAALTAVGCSSSSSQKDQKPVFPVRGQVFYKGKPAAGAFVVFVPVQEPATPVDPRPQARVEQDGSFTLSTYGDKDGAPAGEYFVSVRWEGSADEGDRLGERYADPKKSLLGATVREGPNEIPAFKLK